MKQADEDCQELANKVVRNFLARNPGIRDALKRDFLMAGCLSKQTKRAIAACLKEDLQKPPMSIEEAGKINPLAWS